MGGIKDYTYQNIIFVHDFVFIFLILIFWVIVAYFIVILVEYTLDKHGSYFRLFFKDFLVPTYKFVRYMRQEILYLRKINDLKTIRENRKYLSQWNHTSTEFSGIVKYAIYMKEVLNQVHNLKLEVV